MHYLDTNILIYSIVNLDETKQQKAQDLIFDEVSNSTLLLAPLTLQEIICTLAILEVESSIISDSFHLFKKYSLHSVDSDLIQNAFELSRSINYHKKINDVIHLKFAEKYASKLLTFNKDFRKLKALTNLEIEIFN